MFDILFVLMIFIAIALAVALIYIPILIADARGVCGSERTMIVVLSWLGILFGFTWFIALIMSLVCAGDNADVSNLDKLTTVARLYKDKAITKTEYERLKKKLLGK